MVGFKVLTELQEVLNNKFDIELHPYIDRLRFYTDACTSEKKLNGCFPKSKNNMEIRHISLPSHYDLDRRVEFMQPSSATLRKLSEPGIISGNYILNYVELALDFVTKDKRQAKQLGGFFAHHLVHERAKGSFYFFGEKETYYFSPKADKARLVFYYDKKSKVSPSRDCVHLEYRIADLKTCKELGFYTLKDISSFDYIKFWNEHLDIRFPIYTRWGEFICKPGASRQAQHKAGAKAFGNVYCLQESLSTAPEYSSALKRASTANALKNAINEYL